MSRQKRNDGFMVRDRRSGFAIIDNLLIDDYGPTIGAYGIATYCILVRFARADGTESFPSYQKVADLMGASRNTAIKAIKGLVKLGLVEKEKRSLKGESLSNSYVLIDITRIQELHVVGSASQIPPSASQIPPSASQIPPSASREPDQDTNNKTPITRHHNNDDDDDDGVFSSVVKVNSSERAVREATRNQPIAPELLGLRKAANDMVEETLGPTSWDGWEKYRDQLSKAQLRLVCYWCRAVALRWLSARSEEDEVISNPVGLVRYGVQSETAPGIPPDAQQSVDEYINIMIEQVRTPHD